MFDKDNAIEKLKILRGIPPHDSWSNICYGDGYYAKSIEREFGMPLEELAEVSGFNKIEKRYKKKLDKLRKEFK